MRLTSIPTTPPFAQACLACALATALPGAGAQTVAVLDAVTVQGHYLNAVGSSDAASAGVVTAQLMASRPTLRPAEVLEFVPGVIVSQHSGDGKANQYYLRGFNLDHGTDFATFVDGMPVNMPTHAHGQGYSDLNWLIPELVERIDYRKGPYQAQDGDFASAGTARLRLLNGLPKGLASLTLGEHGYQRALLAHTSALSAGQLLYALELGHNNGPWETPENFRRTNGVLRYSLGEGATRQTLTAMGYSAQWRATDQVPQRALDAGLIGRFGAIDPSDRGQTERLSLSYGMQHTLDDGLFKLDAYAISSKLDLFSNFTYLLNDPVHGDQFEQAEQRQVLGLHASRSWDTTLGGLDSSNTVGLQVRHDRLSPVGLYAAEGGQRRETVQESRVRQSSVGVYAENATRWTPWLRTVLGWRTDQHQVKVTSSVAENSGQQSATLSSPKLSVVWGPWAQTEYFFNHGFGFHSNDARGVTATVSPRERLSVSPSQALVRSVGTELGLRGQWLPGLQTSLAVWRLKLGSELVFSGDAGDTQASGASQRHGVEFNNHYVLKPGLLLDLDVALSQARFNAPQGDAPNSGRFVPGAVNRVASLGVSVDDMGPWFGHFQWRYFGPRALTEDNSQRSKGTLLASARVGYQLNAQTKLALDVFNLFGRRASDIDYFYTSRLAGEAAEGVAGVHSHPVEPRAFRLTLNTAF